MVDDNTALQLVLLRLPKESGAAYVILDAAPPWQYSLGCVGYLHLMNIHYDSSNFDCAGAVS